MHIVEYLIIGIYLAGMLLIGVWANRRQKDLDDYYVGGRNKGVFSIMALWVSGWIGGASIIGTSTKAYNLGITAVWYVAIIGLACLLFAVIFSERIARMGMKLNLLTYSDFLSYRYDNNTAFVATISNIIANVAYLAAQLVASASIISFILGTKTGWSFVISTAIVVIYTTLGGLDAVTYTDWAQFVLIIIGVVVIGIPISLYETGGVSEILEAIPSEFLDIGAWGWISLAGFATSTILSFFTSMDSYTKSFAARDPKTSKKGMILSSVALIGIAIACTLLGLAAYVLLPGLGDGGQTALIQLIFNYFPIGLRVIVLTAILAALMSTADISVLSASVCITNDIYLRFFGGKKKSEDKDLLKVSVLSSFVVGIVGAFIAWKLMDIMNILYIAFTFNSAALFIPTVSAFFYKRANAKSAFYSMSASLFVVIFWYAAAALNAGELFTKIDPLWPGLITSIIVFFSHSMSYCMTQDEEDRSELFIKM